MMHFSHRAGAVPGFSEPPERAAHCTHYTPPRPRWGVFLLGYMVGALSILGALLLALALLPFGAP